MIVVRRRSYRIHQLGVQSHGKYIYIHEPHDANDFLYKSSHLNGNGEHTPVPMPEFTGKKVFSVVHGAEQIDPVACWSEQFMAGDYARNG